MKLFVSMQYLKFTCTAFSERGVAVEGYGLNPLAARADLEEFLPVQRKCLYDAEPASMIVTTQVECSDMGTVVMTNPRTGRLGAVDIYRLSDDDYVGLDREGNVIFRPVTKDVDEKVKY